MAKDGGAARSRRASKSDSQGDSRPTESESETAAGSGFGAEAEANGVRIGPSLGGLAADCEAGGAAWRATPPRSAATPKRSAAFVPATMRDGSCGDAASGSAMPPALEQRIRRGFFADAAWCTSRYGVTVEDLLAHVAAARSRHRSHVLRQIQHVPDLAVAVACAVGAARAWSDASEWFEPVLVRGCRMRLDAIDAVVFARQFLAEVRANSLERRTGAGDGGDRGVAMQDFVGNRPLRTWLVDRLLGRLERVTRLDELPHEDHLAAAARSRAAAVLRLVD